MRKMRLIVSVCILSVFLLNNQAFSFDVASPLYISPNTKISSLNNWFSGHVPATIIANTDSEGNVLSEIWLLDNNEYIFGSWWGGTMRMVIYDTGNVGIGTGLDPGCKLGVNGTIKAEQLILEDMPAYPDYVFKEDYKLPTLQEVETFIKENRHLPDIPTEKEVKEKGLFVSDMMVKQMQKIEELTLYLIDMKKENETLKKQFQKENDALKKRIAALETE